MPEQQIVQIDEFMELHQFGGQFFINSAGRWVELGASREEAEQRLDQLQDAVRSLTKGKAA